MIRDKFTKKIKPIFVHINKHYELENEKYNLILSPAFYWLKKENIAIKSKYKAKQLAESVFGNDIEEAHYKYLVKKTENEGEFYFFAFDEEQILKKLKSIGIEPKNIHNIYFAQNEFEEINEPIQISKTLTLIKQDGIVSLLPTSLAKNPKTIDLGSKKLSNQKIPIRTYSSFGLKNSQIFMLSILFAIVLLTQIFENIHYKNILKSLQNQKIKIYKTYSLPTSSYQIKSIEKSLQNKEKKVNSFKQSINKLVMLSKTTPLKSFEITKNNINAIFENKNFTLLQNRAKKLLKSPTLLQKQDSIILKANM